MHGYNEPLRFAEIPVPDVGADEVLMKVAPACLCHSNFQLVAAYFREALPVAFPIPGHAGAGTIAAVGADEPQISRCVER
jgi:propanol-preferring alcohol dehydrogenase